MLMRFRLFDVAGDEAGPIASTGTPAAAHACAKVLSAGGRVAIEDYTNKEVRGELLAVYVDGKQQHLRVCGY